MARATRTGCPHNTTHDKLLLFFRWNNNITYTKAKRVLICIVLRGSFDVLDILASSARNRTRFEDGTRPRARMAQCRSQTAPLELSGHNDFLETRQKCVKFDRHRVEMIIFIHAYHLQTADSVYSRSTHADRRHRALITYVPSEDLVNGNFLKVFVLRYTVLGFFFFIHFCHFFWIQLQPNKQLIY